MRAINRREVLGYAAAAVAAPGGALAAEGKMGPLFKPVPTNPLGAQTYAATICTPDLEASIHFYRDILGYTFDSRGTVKRRNSSIAGLTDGAKYALIVPRAGDVGRPVRNTLRIIEIPANAAANRPRPQSQITDYGFAVIQCGTRSSAESYETLTKNGVKTISPPLDYMEYGVKVLPGANPNDPHNIDVRSYSAFGPAGEQIFITQFVKREGVLRTWEQPEMHNGMGGCDLMSGSRWPAMAFYEQVFGLKQTRDSSVDQANVVTLIGAAPDTYFHYVMLGESNSMELWEYPQRNPRLVPTWPTDLNRTGLAMTTFVVNDLKVVKARIKQNRIKILGEGALPMPTSETQEAVFIRGRLGELIEIIGR